MSELNIKPLGDRVLVEPLSRDELGDKTDSGIIIPETAKERPEQGKIVNVGNKIKNIKVGQKVIFSKYGPTEIKVGEKEYLIIKEEDILAIIE